jgi:hypothetical protein
MCTAVSWWQWRGGKPANREEWWEGGKGLDNLYSLPLHCHQLTAVYILIKISLAILEESKKVFSVRTQLLLLKGLDT